MSSVNSGQKRSLTPCTGQSDSEEQVHLIHGPRVRILHVNPAMLAVGEAVHAV